MPAPSEPAHVVDGDYKTIRFQEEAAMMKGTILEPHTVRLLAMLFQEDQSMTAERRHDCQRGWCEAIGIQGHNICARGTPLIYVTEDHPQKFFCSWKGNKSPTQQFEEAYPVFSTDFREQMREYILRMTDQIASGKTVDQAIQSWNPNEAGRIAKVKKHESIVRKALGI